MKYKALSNSIDQDYQHYLGQEGIYTLFFGHKLTRAAQAKARYIWKRLVEQHNLRRP